MSDTAPAVTRAWVPHPDIKSDPERRAASFALEEAVALAGPEGDAYDALLDDYEPGAKGRDIQATFDAMRPRLVALPCLVALPRPAPSPWPRPSAQVRPRARLSAPA